MKVCNKFVLICVGLSLAGRAGAALVGAATGSIFSVDGLMADGMDGGVGQDGKFFHAEIRSFPLRDAVSRAPARPPSQFGGAGVRMPPRGGGMAALRAAEVYAESRDWKRALDAVQKGLDSEPDDIVLIRRAAAFAALARKFGAADEYFRRAVEAAPTDVAFLSGRAGILIRLLRLNEAAEMADRALAIDPGYLSARFNRVCIQIAQGETEADAGPWRNLATPEILQLADWLDADRADYVASLSEAGFGQLCDTVLGPGTSGHLSQIVDVLKKFMRDVQMAQWDSAQGRLEEVKELGLHGLGIDIGIARCRFQQHDKEGARQLLARLESEHPDSAQVAYNHGAVLLSMDRTVEAEQAFRRALALDPEDAQASFALACAYAGQGRMNDAWPILTVLAGLKPADLVTWLQADEPSVKAIRDDPRLSQLMLPRPTAGR